MSEHGSTDMKELANEVRELRETLIRVQATLTALDLPSRVKEIDDKVGKIDKRVVIMETRFGPLVAIGSAILSGIVAWAVNVFSAPHPPHP